MTDAQILASLHTFLLSEFEAAVAEYVNGRRHFVDSDRMTGASTVLAYLNGLSGGVYGLSSEALEQMQTKAGVNR